MQQSNQEWLADYDKEEPDMSLTAKSEGGDFKPAPAGNHVAICYAVIDLGTQHQDAFVWEGKAVQARDVKQILIMWELPHEMVTFEKDGVEVTKPQGISSFYTNSLNEKATLRQHLEAWRKRPFTQEELAGFNVSAILGKPCMLNVVHKANGKTKITGVGAMPKGMDIPQQANETLMFDMDDFDQLTFDNISEGIQNIIKRSAEWDQNNFEEPTEQPPYETDGFEDSDIPF